MIDMMTFEPAQSASSSPIDRAPGACEYTTLSTKPSISTAASSGRISERCPVTHPATWSPPKNPVRAKRTMMAGGSERNAK
jgi:hypothetical protein